MTFRNPMLLTASALGILITLGATGEVPAGQGAASHPGAAPYHAAGGMPNGYGHPAIRGAAYDKPMGKSCDSKMKDAKVVDADTGGADPRVAATVPGGDR